MGQESALARDRCCRAVRRRCGWPMPACTSAPSRNSPSSCREGSRNFADSSYATIPGVLSGARAGQFLQACQCRFRLLQSLCSGKGMCVAYDKRACILFPNLFPGCGSTAAGEQGLPAEVQPIACGQLRGGIGHIVFLRWFLLPFRIAFNCLGESVFSG